METTAAITATDQAVANRRFSAFDRLPPGVAVTVDRWALECEAPATLDLLDRYMAAQLAEPLPPLKSVLVHYPRPDEIPTVIQFYCQASEICSSAESAWDKTLAQRVQRFKKALTRDELEMLYERLESRYCSREPVYYGDEPHWYRQARLWSKRSH